MANCDIEILLPVAGATPLRELALTKIEMQILGDFSGPTSLRPKGLRETRHCPVVFHGAIIRKCISRF